MSLSTHARAVQACERCCKVLNQSLALLTVEHEEKMRRKRSQLDYQDVTPCREDVVNKWKSLLGKVKTKESSNRLVTPKVDLWNLVIEG